ncbi:MAG: hydroxymethylglutaryl-CoA lyase [Paracoccus sp. (in: a-proteobacteria)]|uniref:hydroxymethylglutaryl-CoA lyase n=1 Tax=Paracoccus sp. TaxID=267 RepID=UPI0026DEAE44|nr:hydroxymethylglutaryl-CoA lyase [Paracoccus sp. (in: a-proteobacteria)]MDO5632375.1 hydroxymethylglutaryl-CoA lyase [Paracoccus sp. (in: a-proteobacteria)]
MTMICEVGTRDGLQNLGRHFSVAEKRHMLMELHAAGLRHFEAVSMVNPARVPQMAGAEELLASLPDLPDSILSALALNWRGADRALATRIDELRFAIVASDTFCQRNQNMTSAESITEFAAITPAVRAANRMVVAVIATAYGCPFEGEISGTRVADMTEAALRAGADQIVFADTIGVAAPRDILRVHHACKQVLGATTWGIHLHNTRNTGYANLITALQCGATVVDSAIGGLGGCPFAPAVTGNIATEDVNYLLQREGIETGVDHDRLTRLIEWLSTRVPEKITGQLSRAGWFPA